MKRPFLAAIACSLLLVVSSAISGEAQTNPSVEWDSDSDWTAGTYENARVHNGSVDIGIYPSDPYFTTGSEWTFSTNKIIEVDDLTAGYSGGQAYFYAGDDAPISGETGRAEAYATNSFYLDSAGIDGATLEFWWKGYSGNFNETGDGYTTLEIELQKPNGSWISKDQYGNLWTKKFETPSSGAEGTQSVNLSASDLSQSGYYTMKIYVYWYFELGGWGADDDFTWYVDDISFGLKKATHTTSWKDMGATSAWQTLGSGTSIGGGQSITATVQVSDDMSTVKWTKVVTLSALENNSITDLPDARYVRIVSSFTTSSEANTPRLDNYKVTADPLPTLTSGDVDPDNGPQYTTFTYAVTYTDPDGDEPSYVKVYIDGTGYDMTKITGTYTGGATYQFLIATLDVGDNHTYYFYASDGTSTVRLPTSGSDSGPIVELTPTTLSVSPSSFSVSSEGTKTLTATLTAGDSPLANKTITWAKTAGSLSATSGTTNSSGQVSVTYTAPSVSTSTGVTVSASFAGDSQYGSSSDSSSGTVTITPPPFEATFTFRKPDGSSFANTVIYYGISSGQETSYLGKTDSYGRITSTNSALADNTIYFKSSDGTYSGSIYVPQDGGSLTAQLTETGAPGAEFPWAIMLVVIIAIVGGVAGMLALKKVFPKPKPVKRMLKVKPSKPAPVKPAGLFCPHCKLKLPADAAFCPECGRKIKRR